MDPATITFLAISHSHADHMGNANDYAGATWLVQDAEREFADAMLLTGDLYHYPEERAAKTFPSFEWDKEQTGVSRARVEALVERVHAQLWIEHDILGYARLRKAPEYYD